MRLRTPIFVLLLAALVAPSLAAAAIVNVSVGPGNAFAPKFPTINVGDTVRWTLMGGLHNVNSDTGLFRSGDVSGSWGPFDFTFNSAGTFGYHCEAHGTPGSLMFGTITVGGGGGAPGTLQFSAATASVGEGAGSKTITVTRTGGDNGAVSVGFATSNGSAAAGSDYTANSGTLNWADHDDTAKSFVVAIIDDSAEETSETINLTLSAPGGGATLGSPATATLTINDNDTPSGGPGTIRFTGATASVGESAANVTLTAERVDGSTGAVSVAFATADGTAIAGSDYQTTTGTLSWGNGDSADKTIQVPIVGDTIEETSETFTANLSAPTGGAAIGTPASATVTIADDDITCDPCVADATTLCLAGGSGNPARFRVRVTWTDFVGGTGPGLAVPFTADSGFFYFFDPLNVELLVKMVNACSFNNHYWLYNAAASNVGLTYQVRDTVACQDRTVTNPVGTFASNGDIEFFATCP